MRHHVLLTVACFLTLFLITTSWLRSEYLEFFLPSKSSSVQKSSASKQSEQELVQAPTPTSPSTTWIFDAERDERNYGLSDEQCLLAFPDYYREIDRAVASRGMLGPVTLDDVDISWRDEMVRAMIYDRQVGTTPRAASSFMGIS